MNTEAIQTRFNAVSERYDSQRRILIPCFDAFYQTAAALTCQVPDVRRVLDLGAGTGLMSAFVYHRHPQAEFTLTDISEQMLAKARERFDGLPNFRFTACDLTQAFRQPEHAAASFADGSFDLIVSGLAIHHLEHPQKQSLFRQISRLLAPNGWFVNADQVLGEDDTAEAVYTSAWREHVLRSTELSDADKAAAFERIQLDRMATLSDQLRWLADAGLSSPNLYFQHYNFVVYAARKAA